MFKGSGTPQNLDIHPEDTQDIELEDMSSPRDTIVTSPHLSSDGDIRSLEDLTYDKRREFLAKYPLPCDFPVVSFHTEVSIAPNVLSEMSHIAHAEFPWLVSSPGTASEESTVAKLPVIIPLPAVMAVCAKHIELRYGHKSDGLVVRQDAEVPGSVVVRPDQKLDHAWMVYSPARKAGSEPDSSCVNHF